MKLPQNLVPNEPELKDLLDLVRKDIFLGLNCHAIGTITAFDPVKQLASATINYKKTYSRPDATGVYGPVLVDYPQLADCPVMVLGGGGTAITFPIAVGDECFVMFNDRDFDNWLKGSSSSGVATTRLHSFSDGVIFVGVRSLANVIQGYDPENPQIQSGGLTVTFRKAGGFRVENAIGWWDFKDNADVEFDTGTVQGLFGHGGHVKFANSTGELIAALITILQTATAGGFPLVADLSTLISFKEP